MSSHIFYKMPNTRMWTVAASVCKEKGGGDGGKDTYKLKSDKPTPKHILPLLPNKAPPPLQHNAHIQKWQIFLTDIHF